jgi:hypothetical protein
MKFTKVIMIMLILVMLSLVACSSVPEVNSGEDTTTPSTEASEPTTPELSLSVKPSQSGEPNYTDEVSTYSEQDVDDYLTYLKQSLSEDQHGGIYRVSDYNSSGIDIHGGADQADPYILLWAVDKTGIESAIESYSGQEVKIVQKDAKYSLHQLNTVLDDLQNNDIAQSIDGMVLGEDNKIHVDVIGQGNAINFNQFWASYENEDAISFSVLEADNPEAEPTTDGKEEYLILIEEIIEQYKNGSVDVSDLFPTVPEDFEFPDSISDLDFQQDEMGYYTASVVDTGNRYEMFVRIDDMSYDGVKPEGNPHIRSVLFNELS